MEPMGHTSGALRSSLFTMTSIQDKYDNSSIKEHVEAGMKELVFLAEFLLLPRPNEEDTCSKTQDHVSKASNHLSEAELKLESHLLLVDSESEALIAVKKLVEDELQEKKVNLADLRSQITALKEAEQKAQEMLVAAEQHLENSKEQLREAQEAVAKNEAEREIGIWLMTLPGLGSLVGAGVVAGYRAALSSAVSLVAEAQKAVESCTAEMAGYREEIAHISQKQQEMQASIDSLEQRIPQIQAQCNEFLIVQREVTTLQSWIRKCLSLLDLVAGKIHAVAVMSSQACVTEFMVDVLEEIADVLGGKDGVTPHADKEIQALALEINKAVQSLRAGGESMLIE